MATMRELAEEFGAMSVDRFSDRDQSGTTAGSHALTKRRDILPVGWIAMLSRMMSPTPPLARSS